jgi:hypothetical protein
MRSFAPTLESVPNKLLSSCFFVVPSKTRPGAPGAFSHFREAFADAMVIYSGLQSRWRHHAIPAKEGIQKNPGIAGRASLARNDVLAHVRISNGP